MRAIVVRKDSAFLTGAPLRNCFNYAKSEHGK